ncbi:DUF1707 domain-containing protein [Nocardioides sp. LHG3406-4]|uniref:DUF1707 SHOCT-like domain-containing protein n=1 Tax=Nocardioides sp. LHG3406-4 TaxID=2804575 RepID=UPI003CF26E4A
MNHILRIGDAERERAAADLADHFAHGRLGNDEYDERLDAIWTARTAGDLAPIFEDLPRLQPEPPRPSRPARSRVPWQRLRALPFLPVLAVLIVLTVLTGWPLWVLIFFIGFGAMGHGRRLGGCGGTTSTER